MLIKDNIVILKRDTLEFGRFSNKTKQNLIVPYYAYNFGDISTNELRIRRTVESVTKVQIQGTQRLFLKLEVIYHSKYSV